MNTGNNGGQFTLTVRSLMTILLLAACSARPTPSSSPQTNDLESLPMATKATQPVTSQLPEEDTSTPQSESVPATPTSQPEATQADHTPACSSPASQTPAATEGPYFKANTPERASLIETGMEGPHLALSGYVLTVDCQPVANALLEFWQANAEGQYDNSGYTLRGHQFSDANGRYKLETIVPGLYPGRTEHIHVKVQAPDGPILTTQLFFPEVMSNQSDQIFDPALLIAIEANSEALLGSFDFIISPSLMRKPLPGCCASADAASNKLTRPRKT